tara:strand:- start:169 stop:1374 length:1206 start_codon:yes stop_codon:yes gene_type:complete
MISSNQASKLIKNNLRELKSRKINTMDSVGSILREDISAERNQPPFDRVTMDGIAINYSKTKIQCFYPIQSTQFAGDKPTKLIKKNQCIEIMTGSVLPDNTNCVIPIECVEIENQIAKIKDNYIAKKWQFIHKEGTDHKIGSVVLKKGHRITPIDIALILSCGREKVLVSDIPKIRILSTGSELIPTGKKILPHQIRITNGPSMITMLKEQCFNDCEHFHLLDDRDLQKRKIKKYLNESDVLILSGGISMGKADFVEKILKELDVKCIFYKVKQRPGKPMWFGLGPKKQLVFALPGNPVSAITCCRHYVIPALRSMCGKIEENNEYVQMHIKIISKTKFTHFLPVKLKNLKNETRQALPIQTNTSGDFTSLSGTHGYVELRGDQEEFKKGQNVIFHNWKLS